MLPREFQIALEEWPPLWSCGPGDLGQQAHGLPLIFDRLAVLKREDEKSLLEWPQLAEVSSRNRLSCHAQRLAVVRECLSGAAPDVAWELIEQENHGERRPRCSKPGIQFSLRRRLHRCREALSNQRVGRSGGLEPESLPCRSLGRILGCAAEPELEYGLRIVPHSSLVDGRLSHFSYWLHRESRTWRSQSGDGAP